MKILLTGATGMIGKELGKALVAQGHQLVCLVRNPKTAKIQLPFPCSVFKWDSQSEVPLEALSHVEAIYHLAGDSIAGGRWTKERKRKIHDSRSEGTKHLIDGIIKSYNFGTNRIQTFISASAVGYYGTRGDDSLSEEETPGDDFLAKVCVDWEKASDVLQAMGVRVCHHRLGFVLSRQGGGMDKLFPLFAIGVGGRVGSGKQWMSWVHIDDVVGAFIFNLTSKGEGAFNVTAPFPIRNTGFTQELAIALGRPASFPVPAIALKIVLGEMSVVVLASQNSNSAKLVRTGYRFKYTLIRDAFKDICKVWAKGEKEILQEQWFAQPPEELFPFFCDEKNLQVLTPEFLHFHVLQKSTPDIKKGTIIDYSLKLHGLTFFWKTLIEEWEPGKSFADTQLKGPYKKWQHRHEFQPFAGGTLMRDRVHYSLPMGRLGAAVAGWKVEQDIEVIFSYRRAKIAEIMTASH